MEENTIHNMNIYNLQKNCKLWTIRECFLTIVTTFFVVRNFIFKDLQMMLTSCLSAARNKLNIELQVKTFVSTLVVTDVRCCNKHTHTQNIYANAVWLTEDGSFVRIILCLMQNIKDFLIIHKAKSLTVLNHHHLIYWCQKYWQFFT